MYLSNLDYQNVLLAMYKDNNFKFSAIMHC